MVPTWKVSLSVVIGLVFCATDVIQGFPDIPGRDIPIPDIPIPAFVCRNFPNINKLVATVIDENVKLDFGSKKTVKCNPGYETPSGQTEFVVTCTLKGWQGMQECAKIEIPPDAPEFPPATPGCESIQNAGIADCILHTMINEINGVNLLIGNDSTVLYGRMQHITNVAQCLQGRQPSYLSRRPVKRAIDDAEPKVQRRLKLSICYNECHMMYGEHAPAPDRCEVVDYLHLTYCVLSCLKDQTAEMMYTPPREITYPMAYSAVNDEEFAVIKNDYSIEYVKCIIQNMRPGPACNSYDYLDMSQCQIMALLTSKASSFNAREKRGVSDDGKLYDRILNTACVMKCMRTPFQPGRCFMESLMLYNICLNKCVRAQAGIRPRLDIWQGYNNPMP